MDFLRRRVLIEALREERIEDPLEVTAADATEERASKAAQRAEPDPREPPLLS